MENRVLETIGWNDPARRVAILRAGVGFIGYLITTGLLPVPAFVYELLNDPGLATMVGALLIPAGQKNVKQPTLIVDQEGRLAGAIETK